MTRLRGGGLAHRPFRQRGLDRGSHLRGSYRMRGEDRTPTSYIATIGLEGPHLAVTVTMYPPRVGIFQTVPGPHLAVTVTFFGPKVKDVVKGALLTATVTLHPPVVFPREHLGVVPEHLIAHVTLHPPTVLGTDAYFCTPIEDFLHVPSVQRLEWLGSNVPRSVRYRQFLATQVGKEVVIAGVTYGGGRWHGPLTPAQIAAITAAGYADRIVLVTNPANLPVGLD